jgi:hypothetical protein
MRCVNNEFVLIRVFPRCAFTVNPIEFSSGLIHIRGNGYGTPSGNDGVLIFADETEFKLAYRGIGGVDIIA